MLQGCFADTDCLTASEVTLADMGIMSIDKAQETQQTLENTTKRE